MPDRVLVLCESGTAMVHDLPLPEGLTARVAVGDARVLGPCDEDGTLLTAPETTDPAAAEPAAVEPVTADDPAPVPAPAEPSPVPVDTPPATARRTRVPKPRKTQED